MLQNIDTIQRFSNWGVVMPRPKKPFGFPLKGWSDGEGSDMILKIVLLPGINVGFNL